MSTQTTTATPGTPGDTSLWAPEWWERARDRRAAWAQRHGTLLKRLLIARLVLLAFGLVWLVVSMVFVDSVRAGMVPVYLGSAWLCALWFLLLRTKTLTIAGYLRLFAVSVLWSLAVGAILRQVAISASPLAQELGFAARVAIASVGEESLKLLPLVAIALAAPGRVRRFSVADWALLGLASGAGFLATEEILRRLNIYAPQVSIFGERYNLEKVVQFGVFGTTDPAVATRGWWPGHHIETMVVAASIGLAIALWRATRGRDAPWRAGAACAAVLLVAAAFWSAVTTHAYYNLIGTSPDILPAPLRWWHGPMPDEWGATWMLTLLVLAIFTVDGARLRGWGGWEIPVAVPVWAQTFNARLADSAPPEQTHPALVAIWGWGVDVTRSLLFVAADTVRGVSLFLAAGARQPDEPWWAGPRRAQASVVMNRQSRELALHLDAPPPAPWATRGLALAAAVLMLWLTFSVAPDWVRHLDGTSWTERLEEGWLAQLFDGLGRWWNDLSGFEKALAIGAVVVLSGGALAIAGAGAGGVILGSAAWGSGAFSVVDNADHLADFTRDPVGAVRDYWNDATVGSVLLDAGTLALTAWAPSKLAAPLRSKIDDLARTRGDWLNDRLRTHAVRADTPRPSTPPAATPPQTPHPDGSHSIVPSRTPDPPPAATRPPDQPAQPRPDTAPPSSDTPAQTTPLKPKRWERGDPIDAPTARGDYPAWTTVRQRYWKNIANDPAEAAKWRPQDLERMDRGLAPQNPDVPVSMELHHVVPRRDGGGHGIENLQRLWPWEHADIDPHRFYNGPRPGALVD